MATPSKALKRVRDARRAEAPPQTQHYEEYRTEYESALAEMKSLGGDSAMKELREWMVKTVHRTGHVPKPEGVRKQARTICSERGLSIPDSSPLQG